MKRSGVETFLSRLLALLPVIVMHGPLGKPSYEDDEREAELRKNSYLFCSSSGLFLNVTLFACLATLYASWSARQSCP